MHDVTVRTDERKAYDACLARISDDPDLQAWIVQDTAVDCATASLSRAVVTALEDLAHRSTGAVVVRRVFDCPLPPTPVDSGVPANQDWWRAAYATAGLVGLAGHRLVAFAAENHGRVFSHLVPRQGLGRIPKKSVDELRGHTDVVSFPFPYEFDPTFDQAAPSPDLLVLVGLRNPNKEGTRYVSLKSIEARLPRRVIDELRLPRFNARNQASIERLHLNNGCPLIGEDPRGGRCIRFSHNGMHGFTPVAENAKKQLEAALPALFNVVRLEHGDIALIDNHRAVHGREKVKPDFSADARWMMRCYAYRGDTTRMPVPGRPEFIMMPERD